MVIVRIWEGLGNQMFQYAYARALKENGIDVKLDLDKAYDEIFEKYHNHAPRENSIQNFRITLPAIDVYQYGKYAYLAQNTVIRKAIFWLGSHSIWKYNFYEEEVQKYSERSAEICGNYYVKGWFQSEKYFQNIRTILLKELVPKKKIKVSKELRAAFEDAQSVSLHIRRGDYVRTNIALNSVYYQRAMEYIRKIYKNPVFVVFSDDLEWVKRSLPINGRHIYVNEDGKLQDFEEIFIMSRCKANIIANSTYSWWGAWLNQNKEKTVIAPKIWLKEQGNIVPEDWVIL